MFIKLDLSTLTRFYGIVQVLIADIGLAEKAPRFNRPHAVATGWYVETKLAPLICDGYEVTCSTLRLRFNMNSSEAGGQRTPPAYGAANRAAA